jgi:phage terminase large subunit
VTTPTVAKVVEMRRPRARPTLRGFVADKLDGAITAADSITQPCEKYQTDPVGFSRDILGVEPWTKQIEILEAVRDHKRVSVRSGHKCGKSMTLAIVALWFYFSWTDARVVMSSVTQRQVDQILWREVRKLRARSKEWIAGEMHDLARSGFKADADLGDFREIVGFTAREAEAVAGVSGANILYEVDEASGVEDIIFEAIEGNRAGGARLLLSSNPTRTEGEFFESHHDKAISEANSRGFYKTIHVSSEDTPNVREGRDVIAGLATREWVEEKLREWGEDSPLFQVRVRGNFVKKEDGQILSIHEIDAAEERWKASCDENKRYVCGLEDGELVIGDDPAGAGDAGDEHAFAIRRGNKLLPLVTKTGLSNEANVSMVRDLRKTHAHPRERITVVVDREGPDGYKIWRLLLAWQEKHPEEVLVIGFRSSDRAQRQPELYDRARDELWANLRAWIKEGGELPDDPKLAKELHAPSWMTLVHGQLKATPKKELRRTLGRSPDRADAVALAAWRRASWDGQRREGRPVQAPDPVRAADPRTNGMDPFKALDVWGRR